MREFEVTLELIEDISRRLKELEEFVQDVQEIWEFLKGEKPTKVSSLDPHTVALEAGRQMHADTLRLFRAKWKKIEEDKWFDPQTKITYDFRTARELQRGREAWIMPEYVDKESLQDEDPAAAGAATQP